MADSEKQDKKPEKQEAKTETEHINLKVVGADNQDIFFKIKKSTRLEKLMQAYCERTGCTMSSVRFLFEGQRLAPNNTPTELEMEDGDSIDAMFAPVNPKPFLHDLVGKVVIVRLKWGQEYKGILASSDSYMNIQLMETEEFQDGISMGPSLGEVLIRCNNILYIRAAPTS
ncbi:hypothetical protein BB559_000391 [Furculomyces boomerangus]|uniref:Sm protein F n=2 Tax=Harpellales TaxID=61421 RepID=A0A2T9Z5J5_9FUNG|nr:hypothetical protein BB559_000391 [Furculomyces boomerangus]PVZ99225.1 hypothetical protein BB558_004766 [Smittium angustum]